MNIMIMMTMIIMIMIIMIIMLSMIMIQIFQVKHFISCPASLEEKYSMMRLADLLKRNKKVRQDEIILNDIINYVTDMRPRLVLAWRPSHQP